MPVFAHLEEHSGLRRILLHVFSGVIPLCHHSVRLPAANSGLFGILIDGLQGFSMCLDGFLHQMHLEYS